MKSHSVYVEERTVYVCSCKAEFGNMHDAEAHMRNPPREKTPRAPRPKKLAPRRIVEPRTITLQSLETPESGQ